MVKLTPLVLVLIFCMVLSATGKISTTVYLRDSNTPLELVDLNSHIYRDIMVGTKLNIIVSSDTNDFWGVPSNNGGSLAIEEEYWPYGILSAREPLIDDSDWSGSHLPAAGNLAGVYDREEGGPPPIDGFYLYTGSRREIEPGDWFIIDYNSLDVGDCNVGFYDYTNWDVPLYYLCFSQVRTRDFNNDTLVNFQDYGIFSSHWMEADCQTPDWCEGTDLDINGKVDFKDLMLFGEFWLKRTN
jgi:hypothetical protein